MSNEVTDVTNVEIVLAVLDELGGAAKFVDIEDIALGSFEVAADRFGWRTRKLPSRERVRMALVHANEQEQKRTGAVLVVQNKDLTAWKLTAPGVAFVRQSAPKTEKATGRGRTIPGPQSATGRRVREIRRHRAFGRFLHGTPVSELERFELADLLLSPPDASVAAVRRKVDSAKAAATDVGDEQVARFLDDVAKAVPQKWS